MPRFSIIVPVHESLGYLRGCVESVLAQSHPDFEIIGVDDGSADGSGRLLDALAAGDGRVRAVHLPAAVSIGERRNAGVREARGDYLLFLDPAFVQLPGALQALAERLAATDDPDLLVFGHIRTPFLGKPEPGRSLATLRAVGDGTHTLVDRPRLLDLAAVCWNRAVRREFWQSESLAFGSGRYAEGLLSLKTLAAASTVAALPTACVDHRRRRPVPGTAQPEGSPLEFVDQYTGLFAFLAERPRLAPLTAPLFTEAVQELLKAYGDLRTGRRAYVRAVARFSSAHRPEGHRPAGGRAGLRQRLLTDGRYAALTALDSALGARRAVHGTVRSVRKRAARTAVSRYYRLQRLLPLDPALAVYSAYWDRGMSCNPEAIHRKAAELAPAIRSVWVVSGKNAAALPPGTAHIVPGRRRYWRTMARATYFVNNVNFPDKVVKRPGQIHLQTHHGTPLKKMGLDQQDHPAAAQGLNFRRFLARVDRWDYSVTANPHTTEAWSRAHPSAVRFLESGYPRNDVFTTATAADVVAVREELGIAPHQRALLFAPTHRDYERGFSSTIDLARLCDELGPDTVVLVRAHYFYAAAGLPSHPSLIDVSAHPRVEDLCLAADALITDYSSVMFDYANLDRPIVVHAPDWDIYRTVRGVYFDLLSGAPGETPGAVTTSTDELVAVLSDGTWCSEENTALRGAFRARFCTYDDGRAAERVVRRVLLGESAPVPLVPLAERTPAPSVSSFSPTATAKARQTQAAIAHQSGSVSRTDAERPMTHQGAPHPLV
ncbi:bifunctional glycosyltransferase family 2 protein/CDP-glycerol:glycerophosphate glycerophosphotransferase [Streptomyces sp. NPDC050738]|uniref:bifunctional glycosyltransferase/CDP-glycerol:glycerophosphate glycerophosphotransferase n=1 Tax=Streptomyces sp. NPDC050738 TaxID=3154744 RepID=UPI00342C1CFD